MKKRKSKKLTLNRETLAALGDVRQALGAAPVRSVDITVCASNCCPVTVDLTACVSNCPLTTCGG